MSDQAATKKVIAKCFEDVGVVIENIIPNGREKALVKTKLDEARLWANEALDVHNASIEWTQ